MSQPLNPSEESISEVLETLKTTPYRSTGITKTLLTPCRRLGLSRKFKITPTHNQTSSTASFASTISASATKVQENCIVTSSSREIQEPPQKRSISAGSRLNIQSRFLTEDVEKRVSSSSSVNENECKKLSGANKRKQDCKNLKQRKRAQSENKTNSSDAVPCVNSKGDQSEENIHNQPCAKTSPLNKSDSKKIEPTQSNVNTAINGASKKKFKRCLSMKKRSDSQDELTDMDDLLSPPKASTSLLLSGEFLNVCNIDGDSMKEILNERGEQIKVSRKKRCIVYSSDEEDFVPPQNLVTEESNVCQKVQDDDWHAKVVEIKKQIARKEAHLADLKQAAVYKRLHNVQELQNSVKMWKKCSEEALLYLLPKLQEHGQMDMPMLMKNLNIPMTVVYNIDTDSFM